MVLARAYLENEKKRVEAAEAAKQAAAHAAAVAAAEAAAAEVAAEANGGEEEGGGRGGVGKERRTMAKMWRKERRKRAGNEADRNQINLKRRRRRRCRVLRSMTVIQVQWTQTRVL
jgi:hypothetical protein